jgi:hypothetical protein
VIIEGLAVCRGRCANDRAWMSKPGWAANEVEIARWNVVAEVSSSIYRNFSRAQRV